VSVQLQLVHWNEDLYDNYEEATRREDGIVIIAVFVTVSCLCIVAHKMHHINFYINFGRRGPILVIVHC